MLDEIVIQFSPTQIILKVLNLIHAMLVGDIILPPTWFEVRSAKSMVNFCGLLKIEFRGDDEPTVMHLSKRVHNKWLQMSSK